MSVYVTDTHPLVWYASERAKLSKKALSAFDAGLGRFTWDASQESYYFSMPIRARDAYVFQSKHRFGFLKKLVCPVHIRYKQRDFTSLNRGARRQRIIRTGVNQPFIFHSRFTIHVRLAQILTIGGPLRADCDEYCAKLMGEFPVCGEKYTRLQRKTEEPFERCNVHSCGNSGS